MISTIPARALQICLFPHLILTILVCVHALMLDVALVQGVPMFYAHVAYTVLNHNLLEIVWFGAHLAPKHRRA